MRTLSTLAKIGAAVAVMLSAASVQAADMGSSASNAMGAGVPPSAQKAQVTILSPVQGDLIPGKGWDLQIQVVVPARDAMDVPAMPGFVTPTSPYFKPGPNHYFPGLVVLDTGTVQKVGGPMKNLAGLFQVVGVSKNLAGDTVIDADWLVLKPLFSAVSMPCIRAFVVSGTAPAMLSSYPTNRDIGKMVDGHTLLSNVAKVDVYVTKAKAASSGY